MRLISLEQILNGKNVISSVDNLATNLSDYEVRLQALQSMSELLEERKTLTTINTTDFVLDNPPTESTIKLLINGIIYEENDTFTCDRTTKTITWTFTSDNDGFDLNSDLSPYITICYYSGVTVTSKNELKLLRSDTIPTTGTFNEGDMILKIHPTNFDNIGWIYTVTGEWMEIGITNFKDIFEIIPDSTEESSSESSETNDSGLVQTYSANFLTANPITGLTADNNGISFANSEPVTESDFVTY